jgi:hypothetical protein
MEFVFFFLKNNMIQLFIRVILLSQMVDFLYKSPSVVLQNSVFFFLNKLVGMKFFVKFLKILEESDLKNILVKTILNGSFFC